MSKIAVLGGGFNPPHLGHLLICQQILFFTDNEEVWLMPYYQHPWEKPAVEPEHRLAMCKLMELEHIKVSDLEMKTKKKNFTFETIDNLVKEYPQDIFSWVIGSDLLPEFNTWEHSDDILSKVKLLVFPRAGFPLINLPANAYTINHNLLTTSDMASEKIREMVKKGLSIKGLVLPSVEEYIKKNKLYTK
ncbi:nicotinate (nicotinamide) nucleotide adenylyltransferase [Candidatus Microgenomates bacterium]|nr:nicotinate (nicotinamide) nucleotide adenylyltransferase [Candidatus Microgenomates bacterium]